MNITKNEISEETVPGVGYMDRDWLISFWETFTECIIEMDAQYKITNLRRRGNSTCTMTDVVGQYFPDIAVDKDKPLVIKELEKVKTAAVPYCRFQFLSKLDRYYRWTLIPFNKNGTLGGFHGVAVDVTEQTLKEMTLSWQHAVIKEGVDFVTIMGINGNILYTNPGAYKMAGYDPQEGRMNPSRLFKKEYLDRVRSEGVESVKKKGLWSGHGELVCKDGSVIPIEHTLFSVKNEQGETILIATIIRNITTFVEHEKELEKARKAADIANAAKSEFLSRMSHEIRTPLNAIIGMINIGLETDDVEKKNYCFKRADSASRHLLDILNDILDISKIEANKFELFVKVFNFEYALKNIVDMANVRAGEKHQNFIVDLGENVPEFIAGDELRLSQIITNLLTNAIKFTPENGTIILSIEKIEDENDNDNVTLKIEVSDTGIGIKKEQQVNLFMSFSQANAGISQKFGGTGLGLAISKKIIEMMDGKIWVESELGKGAKFIFTVKVKEAEEVKDGELTGCVQQNAAEYHHYDFNNRTLLIAEDVEINREIMSAILEDTGIAIDYAEDGKQAVDMFSKNPEKYDIILMDINMPELDGYEATRQIRALEAELNPAKRIPIIAMTANVFKEDIDKCLVAGMNEHTGKPFDAASLLRQLNNYLK